MNRPLLFFCATFLALQAGAQTGSPILVGMTQDGAYNGTIIQYTAGDTVLKAVDTLAVDAASEGGYFQHLTEVNGMFYGTYGAWGIGDMGSLIQYDYNTNTYSTMVNFDSATGDGNLGSLMLAKNGLLYGITGSGDSTDGGTIYSYAPGADTITKLVTLPANANTAGSLLEATTNHLFGLTWGDGTNGGGTLFEYNLNTAAYTLLLNLPSNANPRGHLLQVGRDTLYGVTMHDGANNSGTLFKYVVGATADTVLYNFATGAYPSSSLTLATDGQIYGLTYGDGTNSNGTIYRYNIDSGTYAVLYNFGSIANDGVQPWGGMFQATDSIFYGMTNSGGINDLGAIFSYNIYTSAYTKLVDLSNATGNQPGYGEMVEYISVPVVVAGPLTTTVCTDDSAYFSYQATGYNVKAQWQISTDGGNTFTNINGATHGTYSLLAGTGDSGYLYRVIVYNAGGYDTTLPAQLNAVNLSKVATVNGAVCTAAQTGGSYQWIDCSSNLPVGIATSQSYTATQNGSYTCLVTVGNCLDTTNCITVTGLGVDEVNAYNFSLYPNPSNGNFTIYNNYPGAMLVRVVDMPGKEVKTFTINGSANRLDISNLAPGIYQVMFEDNNYLLKVLKLVKE